MTASVPQKDDAPAPLEKVQARAAFWFLLPAYSLYVLFVLLPALATIVFTFLYLDRYTWTAEFVGFDNILYVLADGRFWTSFRNTFYFVFLAAIGNVGLGLVFAAVLDRALPKAMLYILRLAFFLPVLVSTALVSLVWQFIYSSDLGVLNYYITSIGLPRIGWLSDERVAMISVVIMDVWKHFGFFMIILLAALQSIPREITEAAEMDGSGPLATFFFIKIPMIAPVILFCVTYATIGGLQMFESVRILTSGGPGDATTSMVMYMYEQAFSSQDIGAGSAAALVLLITIVIVTLVQLKLGTRAVDQ
ncbi:carbohydrate ABC transporter permease [Arsenicitalea aurantiaca]|nr:sugar ABC transporter permease [Arsenicitalea aurantiaca]